MVYTLKYSFLDSCVEQFSLECWFSTYCKYFDTCKEQRIDIAHLMLHTLLRWSNAFDYVILPKLYSLSHFSLAIFQNLYYSRKLTKQWTKCGNDSVKKMKVSNVFALVCVGKIAKYTWHVNWQLHKNDALGKSTIVNLQCKCVSASEMQMCVQVVHNYVMKLCKEKMWVITWMSEEIKYQK